MNPRWSKRFWCQRVRSVKPCEREGLQSTPRPHLPRTSLLGQAFEMVELVTAVSRRRARLEGGEEQRSRPRSPLLWVLPTCYQPTFEFQTNA